MYLKDGEPVFYDCVLAKCMTYMLQEPYINTYV